MDIVSALVSIVSIQRRAELDSHLISVIYENRASWGLGNKIPFDAISGYEEFGTDGKYKRVLKYPYRKENGVKVIFPPLHISI